MQDSITGLEAGKTVLIGGFSPYVNKLNPYIFIHYPTIGINDFPKQFNCDYWICYDSHNLIWKPGYVDFVKHIDAVRFMQNQYHVAKKFPNLAEFWYGARAWNETIELHDTFEEKRLCHLSTTATDAIHLAYIMGAEEIVLCGVDLCENKRADGSEYQRQNHWSEHVKGVNEFLDAVPIPVFKTNKESPLEVPFTRL